MQYLAEDFSEDVAKPIKMLGVQRVGRKGAILGSRTLDTNDLEDQERMNRKWLEGMERHSEPVVWAWVVNLLKHTRLSHVLPRHRNGGQHLCGR